VREGLEVIEEEADRLAKMIEDLLDASRLQAGGMSLNRADVALDSVAERLAERFRPQGDRHTIVVDFPGKFPAIMGDETRLEQVLANLISNAIKHTPGGEIRISGRVRPQQVVICVSDEGPGIDPGDLPHIFERFYRSEKAARRTKGAGLGLYLARAVIEAHGGQIWAAPGLEKGAQICFSLPR
jgi:signal transduction histidine kinase